MSTTTHIGTVVHTFRKSLGLSQQGLADLAGIGRVHIARIEIGESDCTVAVLKKLTAALGEPFADAVRDYLTGTSGTPKKSRKKVL
jgi:predicted transcriptional regulator